MSVNHRVNSSQYVYGSVAKNVQILEDPRKDPMYHAEQTEKKERRRRIRTGRKFRLLTMVFMSLAALIMVGTCYYYLNLTAQMKRYVSEISNLELELANLQIENDYQMDLINDSIDLDEVRARAVDQLGMKEPVKGQIVGYDYNEDSYMRQYRNVAGAEQSSLLDSRN